MRLASVDASAPPKPSASTWKDPAVSHDTHVPPPGLLDELAEADARFERATASTTDDDVDGSLKDHGLPVHPLVPQGYLAIGCASTTRPVAEGEDRRACRWSGSDKTERGLHA